MGSCVHKVRLYFKESDGLTIVTPARSIDNDTTDTARDDARDRKCDDPAHVNPSDHAPVDRAPCTRAETDTDGGTGDTLGGGHGELWGVVSYGPLVDNGLVETY